MELDSFHGVIASVTGQELGSGKPGFLVIQAMTFHRWPKL
jgi:hypothetical protein